MVAPKYPGAAAPKYPGAGGGGAAPKYPGAAAPKYPGASAPKYPGASSAPAAPAAEKKPPARPLMKADRTPIPMLPSGQSASTKNPPAEKVLFMHGFGDSAELVESFGLKGYAKAFPGAKVTAMEGTIKLSKEHLEAHMMKGELLDYALEGIVELYCWNDPEENTFAGKDFSKALDKLEQHIVKQGGYDVLCGFSDGARVCYAFMDRLPALNAKVATKLKMVVVSGQNKLLAHAPKVPPGSLKGVKFMHSVGDVDLGTCDFCKTDIKKESRHCLVCHDFDSCVDCYKNMNNLMHKLTPGTHGHTLEHEMRTRHPADTLIDQSCLEATAEATGLEIVYNALYTGGHVIPEEKDIFYTWMDKFYRGVL